MATSPATSTEQSAALDAWVSLLRSHSTLTRSLSAGLLERYGLTINDYEALLHLSRAEDGAMRRVDLADQLLLTASGVTRLLDGLEASGLCEKRACETDRRVSYAALTDAGRKRLREASSLHLAEVRAIFEERFSPDEVEQLAALLSRLPGGENADGDACAAGDE